MNRLVKRTLIAGSLLAIFQYCTSSNDQGLRKIEKPFTAIDIPTNDWTTLAGEAATFKAPSGSTVSIPANAFCYPDGSSPKGEVKIKYTEYFDAVDIIASGIPMVFDSAGVSYDFVSGGMLEINSFDQDGKALLLKEGKNIEIQMASNAEGDFNLYYFNESGSTPKTAQASLFSSILLEATPSPQTVRLGQWENRQSPLKATVNPEKATLEEALKADTLPNEPVAPKAFNPDNFVFDLNINVDAYPEFKHFKGILWEYVAMKGSKDPEKNEWIFSEDWTNMSIERHKKKGVYVLHLKNKDKSFTTLVKPVLDGDDYKKALKAFDKQFEEYQTLLAERETEERRIRKMGGLLRTLQLTNLGVWNVDKINKLRNEAIMVKASIEIEEKGVTTPETFYYVTEGNNGTVVIRYSKDRWNDFFYIKSTEPYLIAPLSDGRVALYSKTDMQALSTENDQQKETQIFSMKVIQEDAETLQELKELIIKNS